MGPNYGLDKGFLVNTGQTVNFGYACVLTSNTNVSTAGAGAFVLGVYQYSLDAGPIATGKATVGVRIQGITRCVAGGAVARMGKVTSDATGRAVAGGAAGTNSFGFAITPATQAGDWIDVVLTPGNTM